MDSLEERLQACEKRTEIIKQKTKERVIDLTKFCRKTNYIIYDDLEKGNKTNCLYIYCLISVILSFILGLTIGLLLTNSNTNITKNIKLNQTYDSVTFLNTKINENPNNTIIYNNIYWGDQVENSIPQGYGENSAENWEKYIENAVIIKMEKGCGRMQNRLITFQDGVRACVRYRQNTDQIQGEIFSFYTGRLLNLNNLVPSAVKIVDTNDKLWKNVAKEIGNASWNSNRAVVLTKYVPSLESAPIPDVFKPKTRHLNKYDIINILSKENTDLNQVNFSSINMKVSKRLVELFVELAQWSDLIVFDYLTANLDRMVNNLFNFQWNVNIMDGPAHNLARKMDSGLLVFLDNESGLLHGYRLLNKYNSYHSLMLNNLCIFRKSTVERLRYLYQNSIGKKLSSMFNSKNSAVIKDILPSLPEKNAKILHERIGVVLSQIDKCLNDFR